VAWIESHQSLLTHRKTGRLARRLSLSKVTAIGHLHAFWWWAVDNAPEGDLSALEPDEIADGACWEGDASEFLEALIYAGFVDADADGSRIHEWNEYTGRLIEKRQANAERMRQARAKPVPDTNPPRAVYVQRTSGARAGATVPNSTGQNRTVPVPETRDARAAAAAAPMPPEELRGFDLILQRAPGYAPTAEFYEKILERYRGVDLGEEALKLAGWLNDPRQRAKRRTANAATILTWLKRAATDPSRQEYRNGTSVATQPRNADRQRLYELYGE
jgi:hypothetical protein